MSRLAALAVLAALIAGCRHHNKDAGERDLAEVKSLKINGVEQLSEGAIKGKLLTTPTSWFPPVFHFLATKKYFDPNTWQADLRRIERYYQSQGYYAAKVVDDRVENLDHDQVALEVKVEEGAPTKVGEIEVAGLEELPANHRAEALAYLPIKVGDIFVEGQWEGMKELIAGRLRERGYAEAEVTGNALVDTAQGRARIRIQATPGLRYKFGNVFVATGANPQVAPRRIIEQAQGSIIKGRWYSEQALSDAQARVFKMGVFGGVRVNRGAPDRVTATIPVVVDVREAPFRSVRAGGGLGTDPTRNEIRLVGEWTHRNFFGGLRRLTIDGRVGYAVIPKFWDPTTSGPIFDTKISFEQPRFLARDLRFTSSLQLESRLEQAYRVPIGGQLRTGVIWQPHPSFSLFPSYNLQAYRIRYASEDLSGVGLSGGGTPDLTFGCTGVCVLSFLEQIAEWDRRDDKQAPKKGYYMGLSFQEGGGPLGGDFDYVRIQPDARFYHSFGPRKEVTLALKVRAGTLIPLSDAGSPIVARFFGGGANSMRGFSTRRMSPLQVVERQSDLDNNATDPKGESVPIGGNSLFEGSAEVRWNFYGNFVFATFFDVGFVGAGSLSRTTFSQMQYAAGFGFRYMTPIGPIRLDLARRLNIGPPLLVSNPTGLAYDYGSGCFGLGGATRAGAPEGSCTFFLSIGEAF